MKIRLYHLFIILVSYQVAACSNSLDAAEDEPATFNISYTVPVTSHVSLWLENSYKTKVIDIVNEVKQAGVHEAGFIAVDKSGNSLPVGLYTLRYESGQFSNSRTIYIK